MNGEQIKSLDDLMKARANRRAVTCPKSHCFHGPTPAAFVANYTGEIIFQLIASGLFVYVCKHKPRKLCGVCRHPIKKNDTSCDACGSTDFEA